MSHSQFLFQINNMTRLLLPLKAYLLLLYSALIVLGQDALSTASEINATSRENPTLLMIRRDVTEDTKVTVYQGSNSFFNPASLPTSWIPTSWINRTKLKTPTQTEAQGMH